MKATTKSGSKQSDNHLCSSAEQSKIVFTIRDGNLLVTSKNNEVSKSVLTGFQSLSFPNSKSKEEEEGEIYIEIIRDNVEKSEENSINNISTSYKAFWEGDFELCIDRRTCMECGHVLFTPQQLLHHLQNLHHIQNPDECFVCYKLFPNALEKNNHLVQTHCFEKPDHICEACFEEFDTVSNKNIHRTLHTERFKCQWCSELFPCKYLLNHHLRNCSHRRIDLDCHICGRQFRSTHILQLHSLRHNRNSCQLCHFSPSNTSDARDEDTAVSLVRHLRNGHSLEEIDNILQKLKVQDDEEETLDKLFMNQIEENLNKLSDFNPQNHGNKSQNEQCWEITLNDQPEIISESTETSLQCAECHKTFESKEEAVKHELVHQTPFSCDICSLKFSHRRGFKKHMRLHGILVKPNSVRYTCTHCSINCTTLSALRTHLLTHTDQKPHLCDKCGLKFRRPNALKAHDLAVHASRVLHHCPQCDTTSLSKASLLRHIQCVHGGVRRFICGLCGNRSLQNQGLRRHLKSEHNLEFPPMESLCKKSSTEIHIIPPPENLSSDDPVSSILKFAIREEKLKLEALHKPQITETASNENNSSLLCSENIIEGQSLNILGDVASKAAPLGEAKLLPDFLQPKSLQAAKFLCAGCQHCSDSLNDLSLHLTQCQQGRTASLEEQENNGTTVAKPPIIYSLPPSFPRAANEVSNGVPYQLCFVPSINVGSSSQGAVPACNSSLEHAVLSSDNSDTAVSLAQTSGSLLATSISSTSLGDLTSKVNEDSCAELNDNLAPVTELNGSSRLSVDIMSMNALESSNACQLEFLDSSNFIFQEDYLIREETCKIYDLSESSATFTTPNAVSLNNSASENIKEASEQSSPYNCPSNTSGAARMKISQEELEVVSAMLPDNPKALDSSSSCFPGNKQSNLVSPLSTENSEVVNSGSRSKIEPEYFASREKGDHVCPECDKQLSSASAFKRHLEVHFGGKPHKCSYCDKCFRYKYNLTVHIRSHTGARPFECTDCKKKFRYLSELNEHKLSHNGSKLFSCSECAQQFARLRDLRRHSLSHKESQKPQCHICQKSFSRTDYLKRHIKSHKPTAIIDPEESSSCDPAGNRVMKKLGSKTKPQTETPKNSPNGSATSVCISYKLEKINSTSEKNCASDDLISLAYQAAEDGVEFMFVEEVTATSCAYEQDVEVSG